MRISLCFLLLLFAVSTAPAQDSLGVFKVGELPCDWDRAYDVKTADGLAFLADGLAGLRIVDLSDPQHPHQIGHFRTPGRAKKVVVSGDFVLLGGESVGGETVDERGRSIRRGGFYVLDVRNPAALREICLWDSVGNLVNMAIYDDYLYVLRDVSGANGLELFVIDLSHPAQPQLVTGLDLGDAAYDLEVSQDELYISLRRSIRVYSLEDPAQPRQTASHPISSSKSMFDVEDNLIYLIDSNDSLQVISRQGDEFAPLSGCYIRHLIDPGSLTVSGIRAIIGGESMSENNLALNLVLDLSDLQNIQPLGSLPTECPINSAVIEDRTAWLAADYAGFFAADISDPAHPEILGRCVDPGYAGSLCLMEGMAYLACGAGGWRAVDVSDPSRPQSVFNSVAYREEIACAALAHDRLYVSGDHFFAWEVSDPVTPVLTMRWEDINLNSLAVSGDLMAAAAQTPMIFDLSKPDRPALISYLNGNAQDIAWVGDRLLTANPSTGVTLWEVSLPAQARVVSFYKTEWQPLSVAIRDTLLYLACVLRGEDRGALQILSCANPILLEEVGFLELPAPARGISLTDDYALVAAQDSGLLVIDVSDPVNLCLTGHYLTPGRAVGVEARGALAYVADSLYFGVYDCSEAMGREARRRIQPDDELTAYPNPFNSAAIIRFACPSKESLSLKAFDECGRIVRDLTLQVEFRGGEGLARWEAAGLPSGRYFLIIQTDRRQTRQAVTILR